MLQYLRDGVYLDERYADSLSIEMLSYNAELHVLGYLDMELEWNTDGSIEGVFVCMGMPTLSYLQTDQSTYSAFAEVRGLLLASVYVNFPNLNSNCAMVISWIRGSVPRQSLTIDT